MINIYVINSDNKVIGTVGELYYTRYSIKELVSMYCKNGNRIRFY